MMRRHGSAGSVNAGLRFKKVGRESNVYSARIGIGYRALGRVDGEEIVWFWIGPHSDYDKISQLQTRSSFQ